MFVCWRAATSGVTGLPALESVELCFLGIAPVALVHAFADLASDDATDDGAGDRGSDFSVALTNGVAEKAAGYAADDEASVGIVHPTLAVAACPQKGRCQ